MIFLHKLKKYEYFEKNVTFIVRSANIFMIKRRKLGNLDRGWGSGNTALPPPPPKGGHQSQHPWIYSLINQFLLLPLFLECWVYSRYTWILHGLFHQANKKTHFYGDKGRGILIKNLGLRSRFKKKGLIRFKHQYSKSISNESYNYVIYQIKSGFKLFNKGRIWIKFFLKGSDPDTFFWVPDRIQVNSNRIHNPV